MMTILVGLRIESRIEHRVLEKVGLKGDPSKLADITSVGGKDQDTNALTLKVAGSMGGSREA